MLGLSKPRLVLGLPFNNVDNTVHQHAQNYSMARDAYHKIQDTSRSFPELLPLLTCQDLAGSWYARRERGAV